MDEQPPNPYAAVLADLERERDELDSLIARLRKKAGESRDGGAASPTQTSNGQLSGNAEGRTAVVPTALTPDAFFGMTIPDAIRMYLKMAKRPTPSPLLINALRDGGLQSTSKDFPASIRTALTRMRGEVVNLPNGWALAEWYPGRTFEKKTRTPKKKGKKARRKHAEPGNASVAQ